MANTNLTDVIVGRELHSQTRKRGIPAQPGVLVSSASDGGHSVYVVLPLAPGQVVNAEWRAAAADLVLSIDEYSRRFVQPAADALVAAMQRARG